MSADACELYKALQISRVANNSSGCKDCLAWSAKFDTFVYVKTKVLRVRRNKFLKLNIQASTSVK